MKATITNRYNKHDKLGSQDKEHVVITAHTEGILTLSGYKDNRIYKLRFEHPFPITQVVLKPQSEDANIARNVIIDRDITLIFEEPPPVGTDNLLFYYRVS